MITIAPDQKVGVPPLGGFRRREAVDAGVPPLGGFRRREAVDAGVPPSGGEKLLIRIPPFYPMPVSKIFHEQRV